MIGVLTPEPRSRAIHEFFELFKVAWEPYDPSADYDVVVSTGPAPASVHSSRLIVYSSTPVDTDTRYGLQGQTTESPGYLRHHGLEVPLYGRRLSLRSTSSSEARNGADPASEGVAIVQHKDNRLVRFGYDLFAEVEFLLSRGQPVQLAASVTLEHHIALLHRALIELGYSFDEIPPLPPGSPYIACLTHDVDHPRLRPHLTDHTGLGFAWRASLGTAAQVLRGRRPVRHLCANLATLVATPALAAGLGRDPWNTFAEYRSIESPLRSTFFVIPKSGYPGLRRQGTAPPKRASGYAAADIRADLERLQAGGWEIGLHGLDAWLDSASARGELETLQSLVPQSQVGIRMHWLFNDELTLKALDAAGFLYDSTWGYNQTVGFRPGTLQPFRPLDAENMLELPMQIMDTSLFYPAHMNLTPAEASLHIDRIASDAKCHGGVLTVNWHDRSLAPERLWGDTYRWAIQRFQADSALFMTARDAVRWFNLRRSVQFRRVSADRVNAELHSTAETRDLPHLTVRKHIAGCICRDNQSNRPSPCRDELLGRD